MTLSIQFLGAAGTVTGSKYLVTARGKRPTRILVDAGMFQGSREWREKNWINPPSELLKSIDAVLLTHAHIDHTGILPRFVASGLKAPVYCTKSTLELTKLLLRDSAMLQEEEAEFRAKENRSRHHPPKPLYTREDAEMAIELLKPVDFDKSIDIQGIANAKWTHVGHILGAASINLDIGGGSITFSGDLGRYGIPILRDPEPVQFGDLLVIESTYGDRLHSSKESKSDPLTEFSRIIKESVTRGGVLLIPSFAVGRTQLLLYYLRELKEQKQIPDIPIVIDSPMADDATTIYRKFPNDYDEEALQIIKSGRHPFSPAKLFFTRDREESKKLNAIIEPMIIISASGMLSGGRVLHHLYRRISSPKNTILFVGYQPPGGRGAWIKSGAKQLKIMGEEVQINACIEELSSFSAHADRDEMLRWCRESTAISSPSKPSKVAIVHGEPESASAFSKTLESCLGWNCMIPKYNEEIRL